MFDFDAGKLLIIGVVALIVIGPKDLPRVLRQVGQAVGRLRRMASEFQGQFMEAIKEADLQDIRDEVSKLKTHTSDLSMNFDPARDIQRELTQAVSDPAVETPAQPTVGKSFALSSPVPDAGVSQPAELSGVTTVTEDVAASVESEAAAKRKVVVRRRRVAGFEPDADARAAATSRYRNVRPRRQGADQ